MKKLSSHLPKGIMALFPLAITLYIVWLLFTNVDGILGGLIKRTFGFSIPGLGFLIIILFALAVGWVRDHSIGQKIILFFEKMVEKTPFAGRIFIVARQVRDAFTTKKGSRAFKEVALIEYPKKNSFSLCFITSESLGEVQAKTGKKVLSVFVPTTPNPTSGFLLFIPEDEITVLEMSVEEALQMIISGGVVVPKYKGREIVLNSEKSV